MRPIARPNIGQVLQVDGLGHTVQATYDPHGQAKPLLEAALGYYCNYCEVFSSDLEVEHLVSQQEDPNLAHSWDNFLLACGRCNGADNKGAQLVAANLAANNIYLPHRNQTMMAFVYGQGGFVDVNPNLSPLQRQKAENLLNLVKLDKYPGNPKYPPTAKYPLGFPPGDNRWRLRQEAWTKAQIKLQIHQTSPFNPTDIADYAVERGFFSIWFTVFNGYPAVQRALIQAFVGTAASCFAPTTAALLPRNPSDPIDTI